MPLIRICLALLIASLLPASALAQELKVLLLPFETHARGDISPLRRNIMEALASSIAAAGAEVVGIEQTRSMMEREGVKRFGEEEAFELAGRVKADFAVLGSVTRIGAASNVDWRILDLRDSAVKAFFHESSVSEAELMRRMRDKAAAMVGRMEEASRSRPAEKTGTIDRIVVSGNRRVDDEAVRKKVLSRQGEPFSADTVREDIRSIYSSGYFDDVTAVLSDTAAGKVLTFVVREMPFVRKIEFRGNSEMKEERLRESVTLKENRVLGRMLLADNAGKIKAMYEQEGYYLASVNPVVESADGIDATVAFIIEEGPEVKVKRITVIGNEAFDDDKLKGLMNTAEKGVFSFLTQSGKFNEFVYQNDLALIMNHYFDNGYINADILDSRVLLSEDKRWFYITIALSEGEQFKAGKLDVAGDLLATREELLAKVKLGEGEVFSRKKLSGGIEAIAELYGDKGYAYAEVKPATKINPESRTIDITVEIKKFDLVYIEKVDVTGNTKTRDKVIRREMELGEGDLFSSSGLKRSKGNLRRLGYFEDVQIAETRGSAADRMNLGLSVKERPTGSISLGFGYSSVDKLIGTASVAQSNFMGTGLKLDLSGTVSATSSRYILGVTEPWLFDKPISAGFDIYNTEREYPDFNLRKQGFDVRFGFPLAKRYTRGYVTYKLEDVHITEVAATASSIIRDQEGTSTESSIRFQVRRDDRNDAFFPSDGSVVTLTTEVAGGPLGGTNYFVKYEADAVKYFAMPWDTVFSVHGSVGYVHGYDGRPAPIYERYFLGGINTIRGFETRSVSPRDEATGDLIGGSSMLVMNAEYLFPLLPEQNIRGLVFFDAGNAYQGRIKLDTYKTAAGAGIRWFSPLGPIRIEMGFNLNPKDDESSSEWDFAIGTLF